MAIKVKVADLTERKRALSARLEEERKLQKGRLSRLRKQLEQVTHRELDLKIAQELPEGSSARRSLKSLEDKLKLTKNTLHRQRVVVKRKQFAITVRRQRLAEIPDEIASIITDLEKTIATVERYEDQEQALLKGIEELRSRIALKLEGDAHDVLPPINAA